MDNRLAFILRRPWLLPSILITRLSFFDFIRKTTDYQGQVSLGFWIKQRILNLGGNRAAYWPVHWTSKVMDADHIVVGIDAYPGIMNGCYIQGKGGIIIGDYTQVASNVSIVSANHDIYDSRKHINQQIKIGRYCWIGAGATVLPGVTLGDWTMVGAGAVVTRSFPDGYCVLGGVPASKIKDLDPQKCVSFRCRHEFNGYIRAVDFPKYRKRRLKI